MKTLVSRFPIINTKTAVRALAILGFAIATAVAAQIRVPVPGTAVPMTLQTAIVLLAGLKLGSRDGALSQAAYLVMGALGLPMFAGASGIAVLVGPTGGYLVGFIFAAALVGRFGQGKSLAKTWLITFATSLVIFATGALQLKAFTGASWAQTFMMGVAPFILGDFLKVTLAVLANKAGRELFSKN